MPVSIQCIMVVSIVLIYLYNLLRNITATIVMSFSHTTLLQVQASLQVIRLGLIYSPNSFYSQESSQLR